MHNRPWRRNNRGVGRAVARTAEPPARAVSVPTLSLRPQRELWWARASLKDGEEETAEWKTTPEGLVPNPFRRASRGSEDRVLVLDRHRGILPLYCWYGSHHHLSAGRRTLNLNRRPSRQLRGLAKSKLSLAGSFGRESALTVLWTTWRTVFSTGMGASTSVIWGAFRPATAGGLSSVLWYALITRTA